MAIPSKGHQSLIIFPFRALLAAILLNLLTTKTQNPCFPSCQKLTFPLLCFVELFNFYLSKTLSLRLCLSKQLIVFKGVFPKYKSYSRSKRNVVFPRSKNSSCIELFKSLLFFSISFILVVKHRVPKQFRFCPFNAFVKLLHN